MKIALIYRESKYENVVLLKRTYIPQHIVDKYAPTWRKNHMLHYKVLDEIIDTLKKRNLDFDTFARREIPTHIDSYDLVIVLGGDGSCLDVARHLSQAPLLGVNLDPVHSFGFLCSSYPEQLNDFFDEYAVAPRIAGLTRIRASVNDEAHPALALNDILFAPVSSAGAVRYKLFFENACESQFTSGIWISTATGSGSAIRSAGGDVMDLEDTRMQFLVREPIESSISHCTKIASIFENGDLSLELQSLNAMLFYDGRLTEINVYQGDAITFEAIPNSLKLVRFGNSQNQFENVRASGVFCRSTI